jgi:hypothetical protein
MLTEVVGYPEVAREHESGLPQLEPLKNRHVTLLAAGDPDKLPQTADQVIPARQSSCHKLPGFTQTSTENLLGSASSFRYGVPLCYKIHLGEARCAQSYIHLSRALEAPLKWLLSLTRPRLPLRPPWVPRDSLASSSLRTGFAFPRRGCRAGRTDGQARVQVRAPCAISAAAA